MTSDSLTVTVNDIEAEVSVELQESTQIAESIAPQSLSPVLEDNLTVSLRSGYVIQEDEEFAAELITVSTVNKQGHYVFNHLLGKFEWEEDETVAKPLYVRSVDKT
jgi:hypothetical protein